MKCKAKNTVQPLDVDILPDSALERCPQLERICTVLLHIRNGEAAIGSRPRDMKQAYSSQKGCCKERTIAKPRFTDSLSVLLRIPCIHRESQAVNVGTQKDQHSQRVGLCNLSSKFMTGQPADVPIGSDQRLQHCIALFTSLNSLKSILLKSNHMLQNIHLLVMFKLVWSALLLTPQTLKMPAKYSSDEGPLESRLFI